MENVTSYKKSIKAKILAVVILSIFIITAILGYLSFTFSRVRITSMLSDSAKGIAATTASFIKPEDILLIRLYSDRIKKYYMSKSSATFSHIYEKMAEGERLSPIDRLNEAIGAYIKYKDLLTKIKDMNDIDSPLNIYVVDKGQPQLILTTENVLPTNAIYSLRPESKKALAENSAKATGVYRDKDGIWISAYAPVPSIYSDQDKMLVEINYKIDSYIARLHKELGMIILVCLAGFLITALSSYKRVTALVAAVHKLNKVVSELEKENYNIPVDVKSDDEIGHLAYTLEKMRLAIGEKIKDLKVAIVRERRAHLESIVALTNAIEMRDPSTKEHLNRVVRYALLIAKEMGLDKGEMVKLKYACFLHDVGKIYIEEELFKKAKLSTSDFEEIKKHSERGAKIIGGIKFLEGVKEAVLYHQERYDGKGYPKGLKGEEIPLLARIVSIADAFDAMTTDRPYKSRMSFKQAMDEVENNAGAQFDPKIAKAFLKYRNSIEKIAKKHFEF